MKKYILILSTFILFCLGLPSIAQKNIEKVTFSGAVVSEYGSVGFHGIYMELAKSLAKGHIKMGVSAGGLTSLNRGFRVNLMPFVCYQIFPIKKWVFYSGFYPGVSYSVVYAEPNFALKFLLGAEYALGKKRRWSGFAEVGETLLPNMLFMSRTSTIFGMRYALEQKKRPHTKPVSE